MNTTEYCLDPDANFIFDEESLQAAIDMYNDRVVSQKHMVGRILIEQLLLIDKSYFEKKLLQIYRKSNNNISGCVKIFFSIR